MGFNSGFKGLNFAAAAKYKHWQAKGKRELHKTTPLRRSKTGLIVNACSSKTHEKENIFGVLELC